jgi:hypothetical protein
MREMVPQRSPGHSLGASLLGKTESGAFLCLFPFSASIPHDIAVTAAKPISAYLEIGAKRVFAGALEWPGWSRSGRDEDAALGALLAYAPRYRKAVGRAARDLLVPETRSGLDVRERLEGNATTDFGAPGIPPAADTRPLNAAELERQMALLQGSWRVFDRAARAAEGAQLAKGPRGGGRALEAIVRHVVEAEAGYLRALGVRYVGDDELRASDPGPVREAVLDALAAAPRSGRVPQGPRGGKRWTVRFFIRRATWHVLDHAWEIEDRARA